MNQKKLIEKLSDAVLRAIDAGLDELEISGAVGAVHVTTLRALGWSEARISNELRSFGALGQ